MARKRNAGGPFGLPLQIDRGSVEIIYPRFYRPVDQHIDRLLVDDVLAVGILYHRPAHTSVAEKSDLVAVTGIDAVLHLAFGTGGRRLLD